MKGRRTNIHHQIIIDIVCWGGNVYLPDSKQVETHYSHYFCYFLHKQRFTQKVAIFWDGVRRHGMCESTEQFQDLC